MSSVNKKRQGVGHVRNSVANKKRRVAQSYRDEYGAQYPVISRSKLDAAHCYCQLCCVDINVSHGGILDVKKHIETLKHKNIAKQTEIKKLPAFFATSSDLGTINGVTIGPISSS